MIEKDAARPVKLAIIGGGSLNWAMSLMGDLAVDGRLDAEVRLYDIDASAARRNAAIGARYAALSAGPAARYRACGSLGEALDGTDVVVISILPGSFEDMGHDIEIPSEYGIPHSVGDTVGPGGFIRALRAIPMLAEIAQAIRTYAPEAYVCNLTNPMSTLTGALFRTFPQIRAWGACHEVTKIRKQVAWIAEKNRPDGPVSFRDVAVNVLGINHFTFVDQIRLHGRDMMSAYRAFAAEHVHSGWYQVVPNPNDEHARYFSTSNRVAFDLLRRFGIPAAAGDRHLVENFPVTHYLHDPDHWGFALTPVDYRIKDRAFRKARAEALANGNAQPEPKRSDEMLVDQIHALVSGQPFVDNINLPNLGQMPDLPQGAIVETNATFSAHGITPHLAGRLPKTLLPLMLDHATRQTALVDAVLDGHRAALFPLFRSDPMVSHLKEVTAREMMSRMMEATSALVPDNLKGAA